MDSKLLYNQIKEQLPPMEGVAVKVEDNKQKYSEETGSNASGSEQGDPGF